MTAVEDLTTRYAAELRGFGSSLPDEFGAAMQELAPQLSEAQLERWAEIGVQLANHSLRSWEAAAEYFRASSALASELTFEQLEAWAELAIELATQSALMSSAFLKATPQLLEQLPVEELEAWAREGERLCRGNWKSIALSSLYYGVGPRLLESLSLSAVGELIDVVDLLTERSYELATSCLEGAGDIFAALDPADRGPFLACARAVTRASWADTRLYFERGPKLLAQIESQQRGAFLDLASRVTTEVGRQGFPLFADAAAALSEVDPIDHGEMIAFASHLATGSAGAAMEYVKSAPFVRSRLTPEQMQHWATVGRDVLFKEGNAEGAEAYFRLESTRAEQMLQSLSARVELSAVGGTLRLYAKALTGEQISVQSTEDMTERGIGWVAESAATAEGTAIYLPPFVNAFDDQAANFQVFKVFTTHQSARLEFGSFHYGHGIAGVVTAEAGAETAAQTADGADDTAITEIGRFYDRFEDRTMISGLFTIVEDTRIDAFVSREYSGIRAWLRRLQAYEAERRLDVKEMPLRTGFVENLLRASLGSPQVIRWPRSLQPLLGDAIAAMRLVEQPEATVQDSAAVARAIYAIAERIPNVPHALEDEQWVPMDEEMLQIDPSMPGGGDGGEGQPMPGGEEVEFENPPQPDFRGDFKPELVQLMMKLRLQQTQQGDAVLSPLTPEQLKELLENSAEITITDMAEGDLSGMIGMFLSDLEKEGGTPSSDEQVQQQGDRPGGGEEPDPEPEEDLPPEITWSYYDEWDFRATDYRPRWCRVGDRKAEEGELDYYEDTLKRHHGLVAETRRQFELMRPESFRKIKNLEDGDGIDIDKAIEFYVDKRAGVGPLGRVYWRRSKIERDVAVAFLLDMSASTDEEIEKQRPKYDEEEQFDDDPRKYFQWLAQRRANQSVEPPKRIVDLEKEATVLVIEALDAIGDSYGIYGFSGYGRENVEYYAIKDLDEPLDDHVRRRVDKIEPIRSTRMGPAIRHTIHKLQEFDAKVKILILVSDGRPQDHGYGRDRTEKEYAVHDTHQALLEAKRAGMTPFLLTVDKEGHDYLKQMCDDIGYEVVDNIESLPRRLPTLYRALASE